MIISVTIVICTSFIASTLLYISQKHILLEQEIERHKQELLGKNLTPLGALSYKEKMYGSFGFHYLLLFPLLIFVLTVLTFWGYEIFNWSIDN